MHIHEYNVNNDRRKHTQKLKCVPRVAPIASVVNDIVNLNRRDLAPILEKLGQLFDIIQLFYRGLLF